MRAPLAVALLVAVFATGSQAQAQGAGTSTGTVSGTVGITSVSDGESRGAVVVYIVGFKEKAPSKPASIQQKNRSFKPDLVAITAGQEVAFPNGDRLYHNVFSASPTRIFDLGQFRRGESKSKSFPKPGVVDVYCNIHPEMSATILVLPNRRFTYTDKSGNFEIRDVPPGTWRVYAYARRAGKPVVASVTVVSGENSTVSLALQQGKTRKHKNKFGESYRNARRYR